MSPFDPPLKLFPASPDALVSILGTAAQVTATMMGFILAALAILASISQHHLIREMNARGHYADLLKTLFCAGALNTVGFAVACFTLTVGGDYWANWRAMLVGSVFGGIISIIQSGYKFWLTLKNLMPIGDQS